MFAGRFEVCGSIELTPLAVQSRTVRVMNAAGELANTVTADNAGTFCVLLKPGAYQFSVRKLLFLHIFWLMWVTGAIEYIHSVSMQYSTRFIEHLGSAGGHVETISQKQKRTDEF